MHQRLSQGIIGSVLRDSQSQDLRALTAEAAALLLVTFGRTRTALALPDEDADGGSAAPPTIPDLRLIPALWRIDGYFKVPGYLQRQTAVNADACSCDGRGLACGVVDLGPRAFFGSAPLSACCGRW
jgi:hypothetical protein